MIESIILISLLLIAIASEYFMSKKRALKKIELDKKVIAAEQQRLQEKRQRHLESAPATEEPLHISNPVLLKKPAITLPQTARHIPQDSALQRHTMATIRAMLSNQLGTAPTECSLRRHFDSLIEQQLQTCLQDKCAYETLLQATKPASKTKSSGQAAAQSPDKTARDKTVHHTVKLAIPEDATLKRHFMATLRAEIAADKSQQQPTDCSLRRHFNQMIDDELQHELGEIDIRAYA